jgi:opacity protein-like surface antigen
VKRLLISAALACVLSSPALAGDIPSGGIPSPAPSATTQTSPGEVPSVGSEELSDVTLSALLTVLSLLAV